MDRTTKQSPVVKSISDHINLSITSNGIMVAAEGIGASMAKALTCLTTFIVFVIKMQPNGKLMK